MWSALGRKGGRWTILRERALITMPRAAKCIARLAQW